MRSQNRKVKFAEFKLAPIGSCIGKISCLGMLGLGIMLVCPTCGNAASALTSEELEGGSLTSSVSIAFAPSAGSATLSPTEAAGTSGLISVLANVGVTNSGGYSVYLGSNSTNLVGKNNASVVIPGVSGEVSFDNLQDNTWGYYAGEGSSIPENATYKAISQGQGDIILANNNSKVKNENKTFILGFAAKINNSIPADTYENQVTLSVVSNPYQLTLLDIDNMQDMTAQICENTPNLQTKQLKDIRDGKYYWVTKLADNKCWMTQNLALNLGSEWPDASLSDYDVANTTYKPVPTLDEVTSENIDASNTATRSWSFGEYVLKDPLASDSCTSSQNNLEGCPEQVVEVSGKNVASDENFYAINGETVVGDEYDAHYMIGNFYQWNTATAGTGGTIKSGEASGSICPKGWKLPTSTTTGDFQRLVTAGGIGNNVTKLVSAPYYFTKSGVIWQSSLLFGGVGYAGRYWSSMAADADEALYAYLLYFFGDEVISPSDSGASSSVPSRRIGISIRCIAR